MIVNIAPLKGKNYHGTLKNIVILCKIMVALYSSTVTGITGVGDSVLPGDVDWSGVVIV